MSENCVEWYCQTIKYDKKMEVMFKTVLSIRDSYSPIKPYHFHTDVLVVCSDGILKLQNVTNISTKIDRPRSSFATKCPFFVTTWQQNVYSL